MNMERFVEQHPSEGGGATAEDQGTTDQLATEYPEAAAAMRDLIRIFSSANFNDIDALLRSGDMDGFYSLVGITQQDAERIFAGLSTLPELEDDEWDLKFRGRLRTVVELEESVASWEQMAQRKDDPETLKHPHYLAEKALLAKRREQVAQEALS